MSPFLIQRTLTILPAKSSRISKRHSFPIPCPSSLSPHLADNTVSEIGSTISSWKTGRRRPIKNNPLSPARQHRVCSPSATSFHSMCFVVVREKEEERRKKKMRKDARDRSPTFSPLRIFFSRSGRGGRNSPNLSFISPKKKTAGGRGGGRVRDSFPSSRRSVPLLLSR